MPAPTIGDFLWTVLASAALSTALAGLVMFLVKSWITERLKNAIKHEYDVRLESHRAQLKAEQDVELERLKSSLSIAAAERNVAFSRLNERRVEVIAAIYAKLQRLYSAVEDHLWPAGYGEDPVDQAVAQTRRQQVVDAYADLESYYPAHRIFLPLEVAASVEHIKIQTLTLSNQLAFSNPKTTKEDFVTKNKLRMQLKGEIGRANQKLEEEFRRLIGDQPDAQLAAAAAVSSEP